MEKQILLCLLIVGVAVALNPYFVLTGVKKILPANIIAEIPKKLTEKIKAYDEKHDRLTTSYSFAKEYKQTIYKDFARTTTLVNVFPRVETMMPTVEYFKPGFQILETSTTLLYENLNSTVEYHVPQMLNSTLVYPTTAPVQIVEYATHDYQHEILVYGTQINITGITSTTLVNFTRVDHVENMIPF